MVNLLRYFKTHEEYLHQVCDLISCLKKLLLYLIDNSLIIFDLIEKFKKLDRIIILSSGFCILKVILY
jgi:hypothetical protein